MARGTDIHPLYQRGIRWDQMQDIHFVWVKVSDGGAPYSTTSGGVRYTPDSHVNGANSRKIPVGGYHYAQLSPGPVAQANVLAGEVRRLGALGVVPMLDLEAPFEPNQAALDFGTTFCRRLVELGLRPAVYMNSSFAKALRPDRWNVPGLVIVIARYGARPEAPGAAQYVGRYDVHQYTSSGTLPGSAGLVDLDENYTDTLLDPKGNTMAGFDATDFQALMWGNVFDVAGNRNFAAYIKDMRTAIDGVGAALKAQTQLIVANEANDITNESLAAALQSTLTAEVAPVVREAIAAALGDDRTQEVDAIVDGVIAKTAAKLAAA